MKNWKKCVALLLAILMLSALFTGCAKTATETPNESEQPAADNADAVKDSSEQPAEDAAPAEEPVTIKIMANFDTIKPGGQKWLEGIEEKLNVKIEWQLPPSSGYEDTLQMLVLSDDRPDVVILPDSWRTSDVFAESCEGGIFQDISGLLPNYENIMAHTASPGMHWIFSTMVVSGVCRAPQSCARTASSWTRSGSRTLALNIPRANI